MNTGKTLFAQLMEFVPWTSFHRIVMAQFMWTASKSFFFQESPPMSTVSLSSRRRYDAAFKLHAAQGTGASSERAPGLRRLEH